MRYDLVLFDLDGTIADTSDDIADSLLAVLAEMGRAAIPRPEIVAAIGNGVRRLVERTSKPPHDEIVARFMTHYGAHCLSKTRLYPGVEETLRRIPVRKAIVTNKPEGLSRTILQGLGVLGLFDRIVGGDTLPIRKPDPQVVRYLQSELQARHPVLVGDSGVDIQTARNAGIPIIVVTYGYHGPGEIDAATTKIDRFEEVESFL